jgi:hypothetical protein
MWTAKEAEAKEQEKQILITLNNADFKAINDQFDKSRKGTHDTNWYSVFSGPKTFGMLCRELGLHGHYDILYSHTSEAEIPKIKDYMTLQAGLKTDEMVMVYLFTYVFGFLNGIDSFVAVMETYKFDGSEIHRIKKEVLSSLAKPASSSQQ